MARILNRYTGRVDEVPDALAPAYEALLDQAVTGAFTLGLPPGTTGLADASLAAARALARAESAKEAELALRGVDAATQAWQAPRPKRPKRLIVPWTDTDLGKVRDGLPPRYRLFTDLGAALGTREGEAFGCSLENFDTDMRNYRIRQQVKRVPRTGLVFAPPKHGVERSVPVPPRLREAIRRHITEHGTTQVTLTWEPTGKPRTRSLLITTPAGTAIDASNFDKRFTTALASAGIEPTRDTKTHMLRHTAASRWIASGADLEMVRELLGHESIATTQIYIGRLKTADARTRRVVAKAAPKPQRRRKPVEDPNVIDIFRARESRRSTS